MKYSTLQYRAVFSFMRDAASKGKIGKGVFSVSLDTLQDLCRLYLEPVGLRIKEGKGTKGNTISIERNSADVES